jgi:hypothetical protein
MGRKLEFNRDLRIMQVSRFAHDFLSNYKSKGEYTEPFYRTLDRLIGDYKSRDTFQLHETIRGLQHANQEYLRRIHELESERQTKLMIERDDLT